MLVDLYTFDRELDSIILESFPGELIPDKQYRIDESEPGAKLFCFYNLEQKEIGEFLSAYKNQHEYEIRGKNGEVVEVNIVNPIESVLFKNN